MGSIYYIDNGSVWKADYEVNGAPNGAASKIKGIDSVVSVVALEMSVLALRSDGKVWDIGESAELLDHPELHDIVQISGGIAHIACLRSDGKVVVPIPAQIAAQKQNQKMMACLSNLVDMVQVTAGARQTVALKKDGSVWSCEPPIETPWRPGHAQLTVSEAPLRVRLPENAAPITAIEAVASGTYVQTREGDVWSVSAPQKMADGRMFDATPYPLARQVKTLRRGGFVKRDGSVGDVPSGGKKVELKTMNRAADIACLIRNDFGSRFAVLGEDGTVISVMYPPYASGGVETKLSFK